MSDIGSANSAAGFRPSAEDGKSGPGVDFNPNVPLGPAPAITSFNTASAQTMAQKQALLDAIAQNGTAGKQMFANQQAALQGVRQGAIQSQLQSDMAGPYGGGSAGAGLGQAGLASAQATNLSQGALADVSNADARGNANYYDSINAQIPLAQAHTQQQVNAIKSRQDLAAQAFAAEQARLAEEAQMRREEHAASMAETQARIAGANGKNMSPQEAQRYADEHQAAVDAHNSRDTAADKTPAQLALMQDAMNHFGGPQGHGFNALSFVVSHAKNYADAVNGLNTILTSNNPAFQTPSGRPLNQKDLLNWLQRYYGIPSK